MKRRKWDTKTKAAVVMEGLRGRPVGEICNAYQINQTQYYHWRDLFLSNAERVFEADKADGRALRLQDENQRLKAVIGELTLELKKNDW